MKTTHADLLAALRTEIARFESYWPIMCGRSFGRCKEIGRVGSPTVDELVAFAGAAFDDPTCTDIAFYTRGYVTIIALRKADHGGSWQLESRAPGHWIIYGDNGQRVDS